MNFKRRLLNTLRALRPIFEEDVMVVGSEVPNLLGTGAVVVVSQDIDIAVPVDIHHLVVGRLSELDGFVHLPDEPSVLLPSPGLETARIEVNFVGLDRNVREVDESYVFEDPTLPLLVFGNLSLLTPGGAVDYEGVAVPICDPTTLLVEKLLTERSGVKGDRDLLVALGLLLAPGAVSESRLGGMLADLRDEQRHLMAANLTVLSLLEGQPNMPDPTSSRDLVLRLVELVEAMKNS